MTGGTPAATPPVQVRRAAQRFVTRTTGLESWHSFSFGEHYDPDNVGHGTLVAHNEVRALPGAGFDDHRHRDTEIVTWVLAGSLLHRDSSGRTDAILPGTVQRISAGSGVVHSERNDRWPHGGDAPAEPVQFVQMWLRPDEAGLRPAYEQRDVSEALSAGVLVPVVSGVRGSGAAVRCNNRAATLHAARLAHGDTVALPDAPYLHLFVARGSVDLEGAGVLGEGDAARLTATGARPVTSLVDGSEVLVWQTGPPNTSGAQTDVAGGVG